MGRRPVGSHQIALGSEAKRKEQLELRQKKTAGTFFIRNSHGHAQGEDNCEG